MYSPTTHWCFSAVLAAFYAVVALGPRAQAAVTLIATEDNNVLKSAGTTVQGTGNEVTFNLKESSTAQSNAREGFIKFNLSTLLPADNDGLLTFTTSGAAGTSYTLRAYGLKSGAAGFNWAENTITYNTRPAPSTTGTLVDTTLATALGSDVAVANAAPSGTKVSFPISGLSNYRQTDDSMTVILVVTSQTSGTPSFLFGSSEAADQTTAPTLVVPEPTSVVAMLGAATTLLLRRRPR